MPRRAYSRPGRSYRARNSSQLCDVRVTSSRQRATFGVEVSTSWLRELRFDRADQNSRNWCGLYLKEIRLLSFETTPADYSNHSRSSLRFYPPIFLRKQGSGKC